MIIVDHDNGLLLVNTMPVSVLYVQEPAPVSPKDEELLSSISPPAAPGRDTDGGGHQEV